MKKYITALLMTFIIFANLTTFALNENSQNLHQKKRFTIRN